MPPHRLSAAAGTTGNRTFFCRLRWASLILVGTAALADTASAQGRAEFDVEVSTAFGSNVFLLSPDRKLDLSSGSGENFIDGRFTDMESAGDLLTTVRTELTLNMRSRGGHRLRLVPALEFVHFAENKARRDWEASLSLKHNLGHEGWVQVRGRFTPSTFRRNYLVDAVDSNGNGTISRTERVYRAGSVQKTSGDLELQYRLAKSTRRSPFGLFLRLGGGYLSRIYDAPFSGRNRSGPTAKASLDFELTGRIALDLGYDFASLFATPTQQVLLIDEDKLGRDLNENGRLTDQNIRTLASVDYSRSEHAMGAEIHVDASSRVKIDFGYQARVRSFSSVEPLDIFHNGRSDLRHRVKAELSFLVARRGTRNTRGRPWDADTQPGAGSCGDRRHHQLRDEHGQCGSEIQQVKTWNSSSNGRA